MQQGRLRALGVTSATRNAAFPDVPAIAETLPGFEQVGFYSIVARREVPKDVIEFLHSHINAVLALPDVQKAITKFGMDVHIMTREEFADFLARDIARWKKLAREAALPRPGP